MEDLVTYELAVKLKDLGYNAPFFFFYRTDDKLIHHAMVNNPLVYGENIDDEVVIAPTISQVLKWLREEKKRYLGVSYVPKMVDEKGALSKDFYFYTIQNIGIFKPMNFGNANNHYKRFEKAALAGIDYVINNLI